MDQRVAESAKRADQQGVLFRISVSGYGKFYKEQGWTAKCQLVRKSRRRGAGSRDALSTSISTTIVKVTLSDRKIDQTYSELMDR